MANIEIRKFPEGDLIAAIEGYPCSHGMIMSYQHIGQHGEASLELIHSLPFAEYTESIPLIEELRSIGYTSKEDYLIVNEYLKDTKTLKKRK